MKPYAPKAGKGFSKAAARKMAEGFRGPGRGKPSVTVERRPHLLHHLFPSRFSGRLPTAKHSRQIGQRDKHLAGLRALVPGDDPAPLEHVDQAARARVADAEA